MPTYNAGTTHSARRSKNGTTRTAASTNAESGTVAHVSASRRWDPLATAKPPIEAIQNSTPDLAPPGFSANGKSRSPIQRTVPNVPADSGGNANVQ